MLTLEFVDIFSGYSYLGFCDQIVWDGELSGCSSVISNVDASNYSKFWIKEFRCVADFENLFLKSDLILRDSKQIYYVLSNYYITDVSNIKNIRGVAKLLYKLETDFPKFKSIGNLKQNTLISNETHLEIFRTISSVISSANYNKLIMLDKVRSIVENILYQITKNSSNVINLVEIQDMYDYIIAHNANVALLSMAFAKSIGFDEVKLIDIGVSGLLHDVGIIKIPSRIVYKTTKLSEAEVASVKKHPQISFELIGNSNIISHQAKQIILHHHERISGQGYPSKLSGKDVPYLAQICALADVFDAMTSKRPYRPAYTPYNALKNIITTLDKDFDKDILSEFIRFLSLYPIGTKVLLNDNRKAIVIKSNNKSILKPVVRIIESNYDDVIDLASCKDLYITKVCE